MVRRESIKKQQRCKAKLNLGKDRTVDFHMLKNQGVSATDYIKEWVENCSDGGLVIVESFYQRKEDLYQQSLNCVARTSHY